MLGSKSTGTIEKPLLLCIATKLTHHAQPQPVDDIPHLHSFLLHGMSVSFELAQKGKGREGAARTC